ncbi:hypothetical protein FFWV33_04385 [Flavobacterium faecale]|uniref:Uncharacterized protein n=1 Tax=Flavobacterium faecale TaxID=1355330 RepID=A0A2S1LAP5_9FLAO|nr:hypothetical protein [Flavobacterium faecale]AWG20833.1 hypothetical protein FFWV33_04385 [Flavobacterium faecale]
MKIPHIIAIFIFFPLSNSINAQTSRYEKPIPANVQSNFVPLSTNDLNMMRAAINRRQALYDSNKKKVDDLIDWVFELRSKKTNDSFRSKMEMYYKKLRAFDGGDFSLKADNIREIELSIKEAVLDYNNSYD